MSVDRCVWPVLLVRPGRRNRLTEACRIRLAIADRAKHQSLKVLIYLLGGLALALATRLDTRVLTLGSAHRIDRNDRLDRHDLGTLRKQVPEFVDLGRFLLEF